MSQKIQLRRDTAANWTTANPTLSAGEVGVETDTLKVKVGNGSTAWTALAYLSGATTGLATVATTGAYADLSGKPTLGTAASLASSAFDAAGAATTAQAAAIAAAATDATTKVGTETTRATTAEALKAPLASPALTGTPTAPTPSASDNSTKLATTAYADTGDATRLLKGNVTTKTANYTAAIGDIVLADTTSATFTVTVPAASGGKGRIVVKWVKGSVAPTINLTGTDHVNTSTGVQTFTPTLLAQGYQLESDGAALWAVTADDLPLSLLDTRYAAAGNYVSASPAPSAWQASHAYTVGQTFTQAGITYVVATGYTSGGTFGSTDTSNTFTLGGGSSVSLAEKSAWATSTAYAVGDAVNQNGYRYLAKAAHTSGTFATDKAANWTLIGLALDDTTTPTSGQVPVYNIVAGKSAPGTPLFDLPTSVNNANAANLRRARAAFARARSGGNNVRINCYGDSITAGQNSSDTTQYANCYPQKLADLIAAHGGLPNRSAVPYLHASLFGNAAGNNSYNGGGAGESRVVFSSGGPTGLGSGGIMNTAQYLPQGSATLTVGPIACDQIVVDVYQRQYGDPAGVAVTLDGVAQTNITVFKSAGSEAFGRNTYSPAQGTHTLVISAPTTASKFAFFIGAKVRTGGATGGVEIARIGRGGAAAADLINTANGDNAATSSLNASIAQQPCDLALIMYGTNEMQAGTSQATYQANLTTIITNVSAGGGDSILIVPPPPNSAITGFANWLNYVASCYAVGTALNVPVIDLNDRWTSEAISTAGPISFYSDQLHPSKAGYADIATTVFGALNRVGVGI